MLRLNSFAIYKVGRNAGQIQILAGASAARHATDGSIELLADSVPYRSTEFKARAPKPSNGLLMLYGIRDTLDEMQYWRSYAREHGAEIATAEVKVEIGRIEVGLTDRQHLKKTKQKSRFLNFSRMRASLQSEVLHRFTEYAKESGIEINDEMSRAVQIAMHPDFFDRLLAEDPELSALDVLVIPVADDPRVPGRIRQLAYVKPGAKVVSISQGGDAAKILMPSWMGAFPGQ